MRDIIIWYSPRSKKYYCINDDYKCKECGKKISNIIIVNYSYGYKSSEVNTYCYDCRKKIKDLRIVDIRQLAMLVTRVPHNLNAYPIIPNPPKLKQGAGCLSTFQAASIESEITIDRTEQCHNPNFMKDPEFQPYDISRLEQKDRPLNEKEADKVLDMLFQSTPIIEHDTKKRLKYADNNPDIQ